jgi:hypothetical protein
MAGLLVTTDREHFERIDAATARSIYEEVSVEAALCREVVDRMTR